MVTEASGLTPTSEFVSSSGYSPRIRRRYSSRIFSAMLIRDNRTSSVNGAFGRHERHDSAGMRLLPAALR